jgi:hypothetical protein
MYSSVTSLLSFTERVTHIWTNGDISVKRIEIVEGGDLVVNTFFRCTQSVELTSQGGGKAFDQLEHVLEGPDALAQQRSASELETALGDWLLELRHGSVDFHQVDTLRKLIAASGVDHDDFAHGPLRFQICTHTAAYMKAFRAKCETGSLSTTTTTTHH